MKCGVAFTLKKFNIILLFVKCALILLTQNNRYHLITFSYRIFSSVPKNSLTHATFLIDDLLAIYHIHESVIQ